MSMIQNIINDPVQGLLIVFAFVIALSIHEFAHAWTAWKLGDDTPYLMGRVTLNPLAHLDPLGSFAILFLGFGWGRPVLYNPMRLSKRIHELWIALAGPASNLLLALALNVLVWIINQTGISIINPEVLQITAYINVLLASFNMLPIPPLDGSSIIAYFWPEYRSLLGGQLGLIVLLALIFVPIGPNGSLLNTLITPVEFVFREFSTLHGLLGSYGGF